MPENTIRVGLIWAGGNTTKLHIPGLKKQAGVEIVAVANRTRESGQRVASPGSMTTGKRYWTTMASMRCASARGRICLPPLEFDGLVDSGATGT